MKKLRVAFLSIIFASFAFAESNGWFLGVQFGYGNLNYKSEMLYEGEKDLYFDENLSDFRYGFLVGYKHFFMTEVGARYYVSADFGTDYKYHYNNEVTDILYKVKSYNIAANADMLYNFIVNDDLDFGVFFGLGLGYVNSKITGTDYDTKPSGFDLGINFGFRTNIAQHHGIELYSRFGVLPKKEETAEILAGLTNIETLQKPYQVGLRYMFSF